METWKAVMAEFHKFVSNKPVFAAWQRKYDPLSEAEAHSRSKDKRFFISDKIHKPLHVAAYLGLESCVRFLIERRANVSKVSHGFSPLQAAACGGDFNTMTVLLENKADPNCGYGAGRTAFQLWMMLGDVTDTTVETTQKLLDYKADPSISSLKFHINALQYFASRGDDPKVLDLLLRQG